MKCKIKASNGWYGWFYRGEASEENCTWYYSKMFFSQYLYDRKSVLWTFRERMLLGTVNIFQSIFGHMSEGMEGSDSNNHNGPVVPASFNYLRQISIRRCQKGDATLGLVHDPNRRNANERFCTKCYP